MKLESERERDREFPQFYKADNFHFCDFPCALRGADSFLLE